MYNEFLGQIACAIIFVGFNLTFFTQFLMGSQGMPRRYYTYAAEYQPYHIASTMGAYTLGVGFLLIAAYLIHSLFKGRPAPDNPWGANTLEWKTASPPHFENFVTTPSVGDPYDYSDLVYEPSIGGWVEKTHTAAEGGKKA